MEVDKDVISSASGSVVAADFVSPGRSLDITRDSSDLACSAGLCRRLRALGYPLWDCLEVAPGGLVTQHHFRLLVVWLENTQLRLFAPSQRTELNDFQVDIRVWMSTLYFQYVEACKSTGLLQDSSHAHHFSHNLVIAQLLNQAVQLKYAESQARYNAQASSSSTSSSPCAASSEAVEAAASRLGLSGAKLTSEQARGIIQSRVRSIQSVQRNRSLLKEHHQDASSVQQTLADELRDAVPLGFTTEDVRVEMGGKALRMLYNADLKELQSQVNHVIAAVQNITTQPKTDSRLGKVGR